MSIRIYPYKTGSHSARALGTALNTQIIRRDNSTYRHRPIDAIINWGASQCPYPVIWNHPNIVRTNTNKASFFDTMAHPASGDNPRTPAFTRDRMEAVEILNEGHSVVCRHILTGHSGAGIRIIEPGEALDDAPLYVQYVPKKEEYRVHCFKSRDGTPRIIHIQRKARKLDVADDEVNWKIRNLAGGFIYSTDGFAAHPDVEMQALKAFRLSGLDFGAVDIIWNLRHEQAYVLEINCAPGLEGQTVIKYAEAFRSYFAD